jgi:ferrochelatase
MQYLGHNTPPHDEPARVGILLVNLGTPDAPTPSAVRRYLAEFLWDPRVIEMPRWLWWPILHGVILRIRPRRSAKSYQKIWSSAGSPLLVHSQKLATGLQQSLDPSGDRAVVELAMRYGSPSIPEALDRLLERNVQRLLVLPLYPQYSATTTASVFDAVSDALRKRRWVPELRLVNSYHDFDPWIAALSAHIREYRTSDAQFLVFSFHGIPRRYLDAGDPYFCHCHKTARLVAQHLGLTGGQWQVAFQSRFGREEWLRPYLAQTLTGLPGHDIRRIDVVSPGFAADCLETLEEVDMENRERFLAAGGESFNYIPALNALPGHVAALAALIHQHTAGWPELEKGAARRDTASRRALVQAVREALD